MPKYYDIMLGHDPVVIVTDDDLDVDNYFATMSASEKQEFAELIFENIGRSVEIVISTEPLEISEEILEKCKKITIVGRPE